MNISKEQRKQDFVKGFWKLAALQKKANKKKPRLTVQKGFYRWLVLSKDRRTRSISEKFYYNSKLNSIKALWLFRTMYHRDLEKNRVDPKMIAFIESFSRAFDFFRIKRMRQIFSRISGKESSSVKRLRYIVETYKRLQSFKLREMLMSFKSKHKTKHIVDGVLLLQKYADKVIFSSFSSIIGKFRSEEKDRTRKIGNITSLLLRGSQFKKAQCFKSMVRSIRRQRMAESLIGRIEAIVKSKFTRSARDAMIAMLIYSNVKGKLSANKDVAITLASKKLDQLVQRSRTRVLAKTVHTLKQYYLNRFKRIKEAINIIRKNYFIKAVSCLSLLKSLAKKSNQTVQYSLLVVLHSLFKQRQKQTLERLKQRAEAKLYESYYHVLMANAQQQSEKELALQSSKSLANIGDMKVRNFCKFYENFFKEKHLRQKIIIFNKLKHGIKRRKIMIHKTRDDQLVRNTVVLTNLIKALLKKGLVQKYICFKIWERYNAFLRRYRVTGVSAQGFFDILSGKNTKAVQLPPATRLSMSLVRLSKFVARASLKRRGLFFKKCKFLLADKSWNLYLAMSLLTRNIINGHLASHFRKLSGKHLLFLKAKENGKGQGPANKALSQVSKARANRPRGS